MNQFLKFIQDSIFVRQFQRKLIKVGGINVFEVKFGNSNIDSAIGVTEILRQRSIDDDKNGDISINDQIKLTKSINESQKKNNKIGNKYRQKIQWIVE